MNFGGMMRELTKDITFKKLYSNGGAYANSIARGDNVIGGSLRRGGRMVGGRMNMAFGGGVGTGSINMMKNRGSIMRAAGINAGVGAVAGGAYDSDDRMGGAFRGAMLGAGGGFAGRMGAIGIMKYGNRGPLTGRAIDRGMSMWRGGVNNSFRFGQR